MFFSNIKEKGKIQDANISACGFHFKPKRPPLYLHIFAKISTYKNRL